MHITIRTAARRHKGLSLIELSAALFVLTVGMMGMVQMYHFAIAKMHAMNETKVAIRAIQNEIETLRSVPFDELRNGETAELCSETPAVENLVDVRPTVTISDYGDSKRPLKEVTVTVRWTGEHGRAIARSATTLIADRNSL